VERFNYIFELTEKRIDELENRSIDIIQSKNPRGVKESTSERGRVNEEGKEGENSPCSFYTYMNMEH
jgi:ketosteroid isomerase-like protein